MGKGKQGLPFCQSRFSGLLLHTIGTTGRGNVIKFPSLVVVVNVLVSFWSRDVGKIMYKGKVSPLLSGS